MRSMRSGSGIWRIRSAMNGSEPLRTRDERQVAAGVVRADPAPSSATLAAISSSLSRTSPMSAARSTVRVMVGSALPPGGSCGVCGDDRASGGSAHARVVVRRDAARDRGPGRRRHGARAQGERAASARRGPAAAAAPATATSGPRGRPSRRRAARRPRGVGLDRVGERGHLGHRRRVRGVGHAGVDRGSAAASTGRSCR